MKGPAVTRAVAVADLLRQRIVDSTIEPGVHLTEQLVSKDLGVSRTPVREALTRLAEEGF